MPVAKGWHSYPTACANECIEEGRTLRANSPTPAAPPEKHSFCGNIAWYVKKRAVIAFDVDAEPMLFG